MVGYNGFVIAPHLHYRTTRQAMNDVLYVAQGERWAGVKLIRQAELDLFADNVDRILYHSKMHVQLGHGKKHGTVGDLLERLGYAHMESIYAKVRAA